MAFKSKSKTRASNHKKKAWKHIDLKEIDQYLEDKELDERTGFAEKDLFVFNKDGDPDNIKKDKLDDSIDEEEKALINNRPTTRSSSKDSKIFRYLGSSSAVPAFKTNEQGSHKKTPLETIRQSERLNKVSRALDQTKNIRNRVNKAKKDKDLKYDLWQEQDKTPIGEVYVDYAEDFEKVRLSRIFKCPAKQNLNSKKPPSLLPAVEQPHPGLSYNPDKDSHTDLLIEIGEKKKKALNEKKKLNKIIKEGFDPTVNVNLENAKEMASGLFSGSEPEDNEEDQNDEEDQNEQTNKQVIISDLKRPKSKKAKRNEVRERIDKLKSKKRKDKKRLETEFMKIKHYVKEAKETEANVNLKKERREQRKIAKLYKPRRLGKEKYKDPEPEYCLPEELNGSLRKINTDGNLLMDRFKSLQRRNLIEHRRVQLKKRSRPVRKHVIRNSIFNKDLFERENPEVES